MRWAVPLVEHANELLLERDEELRIARSAIVAARAGDGGIVYVEGPGGIGKSLLLDTVALAAAEISGVAVHRAHADELEVGFAFGVLRQLLEPSLRAQSGHVREAMADGPAAPALAALEGRIPPPRNGEGGAAIAYSMCRLIQELAEQRPLVLCIDDVHSADTPTLLAVDACSRRLNGSPVLLVLAARSATGARAGDLLARVGSSPRSRRLRLRPLGQQSLGVLAEARLGRPVGSELSQGLWHATGGNPFLAHQLLGMLHADGIPGWESDPAALARLAPDGVTEVILRRLAAEGSAAERLAEAVAILGECDLTAAAELAALADAEAVAATDRLAALEILRPGPRPAFIHPVVNEAVRRQIPPTRRSWLHTQAAELLHERGAPLEQVAAHLTEGLPRAKCWVVETLLEAAELARRHGSPETAVTLLTRASQEPPPVSLRGRVGLELGTAQSITGHPGAIKTLERALASAEDPTERAAAGLRLARRLGMAGEPSRALQVADAVDVDGRVDPDTLLQLRAELLGLARLNVETRVAALDSIEQLRDRADPPRSASAGLWSNLALSALERNDPPDVVANLAERAMRRGWLLEDETFQLAYAAGALIWIDRFDLAAKAWDAAVDTARQRRSLTLAVIAHGFRSHLNLRRGRVPDALSDARVAYELATEQEVRDAVPYVRAYLTEALLEQDAADEAAVVLERSDTAPRAGDNAFELYARGRLHLARAEAEQAAQAFLACGGALAGRGGVDTPGLLAWRSGAALALDRIGETERAHMLAREELAHAQASDVPGAVGTTLTTLGMLETGEEAVTRLREAVAVLEESPRVSARCAALLELGATLRRHGRPRAARPPLRWALDLAYGCGATAPAERARQELNAAGARPRRTAQTGVDSLTASERRVALLAARGLTNRQIAEQLYVSMRTVAVHLTHVYRKLDVRGRKDLPGRLEAAEGEPAE